MKWCQLYERDDLRRLAWSFQLANGQSVEDARVCGVLEDALIVREEGEDVGDGPFLIVPAAAVIYAYPADPETGDEVWRLLAADRVVDPPDDDPTR